ncbi:single-stranded DNA-binding protein [Acidocella aquatica]|uniref:Single-stranded DNA-binding protein n=1 Tax=Acidocella aquatica TaxID=1922313 RepID=A0ABQ6A6H4_9PROT|nr:single-stranded DNA-binding protein [Acidocella aquatica]GLR66913.1 single-stranded DNA-binding protein [Acidocella aquatica]
MAGSENMVILMGNLGKDPEVHTTGSGNMIVNLSVATTKSWRDRDSGERRERTEWHRVVIYSDGLAKVADKYLHKGSKVYLQGSLQTRKWTDNNGQDRYSTEIVLQPYDGKLIMLDGQNAQRTGGSKAEASAPANGDLDGEIPF